MMKAIVYHKFGSPEVLKLADIDKPVPGPCDVLVKVYATTVEKEDPDIRRNPGINGLSKPKRKVLGMEFAGQIESIGSEVTDFKIGDKVYGNTRMKMGTYAEYVCLNQNAAIVPKPANIGYIEAAALTNGSLTALHFLRDKVNVKQGQEILIIGASGTVGSAAVQLALFFGARVTAVCGTRNINRVKDLGAHAVVDYSKTELKELDNESFDIIYDVVGNSKLKVCRLLLKPNGVYMSTLPSLALLKALIFSSIAGGKKFRMGAAGLRSSRNKAKDLLYLNSIIAEGKLKAVIDKVFLLEEIPNAHRYIEEGLKNGTIAIEVQK